MTETPRIRGRTRPLKETRGTGAWALLAFALLLSLGTVLLTLPTARGAAAPPALEVYFVRHAEKADDGEDPGLSAAGQARALVLTRLMGEVELRGVHSTDYRRTRDTAEPVAESHGLEVQLYDPADPEMLLDALREQGGIHLVVGHSNTTPDMVQALGGDPVSPVDEEEYDRLYRVTVEADGTVHSELRRFGESYPGE